MKRIILLLWKCAWVGDEHNDLGISCQLIACILMARCIQPIQRIPDLSAENYLELLLFS